MSDNDAFDINDFNQGTDRALQYDGQISRLRSKSTNVDSIEVAVSGAMTNIAQGKSRSFVIYGEPQSGKTEMMICLTAKLVDAGYDYIVHLLNDSVDCPGSGPIGQTA